jgi:hypothetical protein
LRAQESAATQLHGVPAHRWRGHAQLICQAFRCGFPMGFKVPQDLQSPQIREGRGRLEDIRIQRTLAGVEMTISDFMKSEIMLLNCLSTCNCNS